VNLSKGDALTALEEIETVNSRTVQFRDYKDAAPYFFIWGIVIAGGNIAIHFLGDVASIYWALISFGAVILSVWIGRTQSNRKTSTATRRDWRLDNKGIGLTFGVIYGFIMASTSILYPVSLIDANALIALFSAFIIMVLGVWIGRRLVYIAMFMICAILVGYHFLTQYYFLVCGVTIGTAYIGGGIWLRRV
jgi:hypothetical protein